MRRIVLPAVIALTLAACAAPGTPSSDSSAAPVSSAAAEQAWADPDAPDMFKFMATDIVTGEQFDGTTILHKDVMLWFWASWCPVCDAEAGAIVAAEPDFPDGVTVIAIGGLSDLESSKTWVTDHPGIDQFVVLYDESGDIWRDFGATAQPTMVLINDDGLSRLYQGGYGKFDIIEKVAWLGEN